jgi:hypothetical protein
MNHPVHNGGALATISRTHRNTFYGKAIAAQPGYLEAVALRDKAMAEVAPGWWTRGQAACAV